jgi:hypothetical protein
LYLHKVVAQKRATEARRSLRVGFDGGRERG